MLKGEKFRQISGLVSGFHDNGKNAFVYDNIYTTDTTGTAVLKLVSAEVWIVIFLVKTSFASIFILGYHPVLRIIKSVLMNGIKKKKSTFHPFSPFLPSFSCKQGKCH